MAKSLMALTMFCVAFPVGAMALDLSDLSGRWVVTWGNATHNDMTLDAGGNGLTGTYTNDAGRPCTVAGTFEPQTRRLTSELTCPLSVIGMRGVVSEDGRTVDGSYDFGGAASGSFRMEKQ